MEGSQEKLKSYWEGHSNGMLKGSQRGWEAGFNAAIEIVSKLHPQIDVEVLKGLKDLLDKSIREKVEEYDPNVRNDEIL